MVPRHSSTSVQAFKRLVFIVYSSNEHSIVNGCRRLRAYVASYADVARLIVWVVISRMFINVHIVLPILR